MSTEFQTQRRNIRRDRNSKTGCSGLKQAAKCAGEAANSELRASSIGDGSTTEKTEYGRSRKLSDSGQGMRLGIDVGGTYTDLVLFERTSEPITLKVPTVPSDVAQGVLNGIEELGIDLANLDMIVHGSTVGVNAIIERKGAKTGLLTTEGFEDVLDIGTMSKPEMYDVFYRKPRPLVSREYRLGVRERMSYKGELLRPVNEDEVVDKVRYLVAEGVTSVAVSTLHSYVNAENENKIATVVLEKFPELVLSVSNEIASQRREFERLSTTVINAYIAPPVSAYLNKLLDELRGLGFSGPVFIMKSNGGVMTAQAARAVPVHTLLSGPVAGSIAGRILGAQIGRPNVITFDMGGTSCEVSVILNGEPGQAFEANVEGYPVTTPLLDISYIGAGGGSIAKVIGDSSLRVGPWSAGADPGPACYGKGGVEATVTDANVVLGRLDPNGTLAGGIPIKRELAREAIEKIAATLKMPVEEAALGIIDVACVKMAYAIRAVTVEQGLDPRDFVLIAFGGAGPLHAPLIAQMVGIERVVVPWSPGTLCAWGMINTDLRHDVVRTIDYGGRPLEAAELANLFSDLETEGAQALLDQGVDGSQIVTRRSIDMRYKGQEHTLTIGLADGPILAEAQEGLRKSFDDGHMRRYAHSSPAEAVEFVNVRVEAIGRLERPHVAATSAVRAEITEEYAVRPVIFSEGPADTPVYHRPSFLPGTEIEGPAVIEEDGSASLVPIGYSVRVDDFRNMVVHVPKGELL